VIGADGLHSATRALTFGPQTHLRHLGCYLSIFPLANHLGLDRSELFFYAPGRMVTLYSTGADAPAQALLAFASPPIRYDRHDLHAQKHLVTDAFAGLGWEVPRLLDALRDSPDLYFGSVSQVHLPCWSRGRVALLGDAAHCPSRLRAGHQPGTGRGLRAGP
jgi:2-polyprenyl-6-methoxyphenol hydroxylase-like FAD-dependent oxidoreductase